jgi:antitoxin-like ribbon-helix-helix protein
MAKDTSRKPEKSAGPSLKVVKGGRDAAPPVGKQKASKPSANVDKASHGKRVQFDLETWHALNMLARDRMMTFQELTDEAFADLLHKHGRPRDLKDALRRSLEAQDDPPKRDR